jgi:hypothetical protein
MLRDFAQNPLVKGVRLTFHRPIDRNWMIDGTNDWYWPLAEELGLPTMVHAPTWKAELGQVAARHPGRRHRWAIDGAIGPSVGHPWDAQPLAPTTPERCKLGDNLVPASGAAGARVKIRLAVRHPSRPRSPGHRRG